MLPATEPTLRLRRPLPALWREPGVLQIGLDQPALVLTGVPAELARATQLLAQPHRPSDLHAALPGLPPAWVGWLVDRLLAGGLLTEEPATAANPVAVVGRGPLADALTSQLAAAGLVAQRLGPAAAAAAVPPAGDGPQLIVLAEATAEPDRTVTDALVKGGLAHLVVRLEPDRGVVGPLVLPSVTPCVRCHDLLRCSLDDAWPVLLAQLCLDVQQPEPTLLAWAAATAVGQVRAWLAGAPAQPVGGALELQLPAFTLAHRSWPHHPGCACRGQSFRGVGKMVA